ncbi:hypothetical protein DPMN_146636 [Dreissena polymorpha]|uniref:Helicase ATP-binding domain-containing protein n=1 Tax=Dreissena polymorpha TaxID=45954 RepID=A0A9D4IYK9_DREPO|nr:hypothetical protein DPMN_146636 [Dreissena polymorpha]
MRTTDVSVLFATPEALRSPTWRKLILSPEMKERLCLLAVDEAHCVSQWYAF